MKMLVAFVLAALAAAPALRSVQEYQGSAALPRRRRHHRSDHRQVARANATVAKSAPQRASKLTSTAGVAHPAQTQQRGRDRGVQARRLMAGGEMQSVLDRLNADPDVDYAVADKRRSAQRLPSDPMVVDQWYLLSAEASATRTDQAWDVTTGSTATIVAVLDTGVRPDHPDLAGKLLPGYDFIAERGDRQRRRRRRDADPTDPGDWVAASDRTGIFANCDSATARGTALASPA